MANITLAIDDALLQAARVRAVKEGTSVNEVCRRAIEQYARRSGDRIARYRALQAEADRGRKSLGKPLPPISREELYDLMISERSGRK